MDIEQRIPKTLKKLDSMIKRTNDVLSCYDVIAAMNFDINELNDLDIPDNKDFNKFILFKNTNFELVLIKWKKGKGTEIHKHPKNGCLMKLLCGELVEERFHSIFVMAKDKTICKKYKEKVLKPNKIAYIHDKLGCHKIMCTEDAYSIHLYSPPNFY